MIQRIIYKCFFSTYDPIDLTFPKIQWIPKNPIIIISQPGSPLSAYKYVLNDDFPKIIIRHPGGTQWLNT